MTKETPQLPAEGFPLKENERLFDRVSDKRFQQLAFDTQTIIHEVKVGSNSFGEFLFVTVSRVMGQGREVLTFWGLGFHEYRERWFTEEWRFHESYSAINRFDKQLSLEEAKRLIQERRNEVQEDIENQAPQSSMGALYEILADLMDEDGAMSELEDLESFGLWLDNEE